MTTEMKAIYGLKSLIAAGPDAMSLNRTKMHWLIRLRVLATLAQALAFIPGAKLGLIEPRHVVDYFLIVLALMTFNVISLLWLHRQVVEPSNATMFVQLAVDLTGLTLLINLAGGWVNPFTALFFLHAGIGALLLLGAYNGVFFLLVASGITLTFYLNESPDLADWRPTLPSSAVLMAQVFIAFMIWTLTNWLSGTLRTLNQNVQVLREQNSRLDRLRAVGAIAAGFSHRIATPLNTIKMRIERIARRHAQPDDQDDLQVALNAIKRCEDILRTYFSGRLEPASVNLEPTDIVTLTQRICKNWAVDHPHVKLRLYMPTEHYPMCRLAPVEFSRSLIDLLDNAREAGQAASAEIDVKLRAYDVEVELIIEDNGPGFASDVMNRLGEPFVTRKPKGAGLGLYTAFALTHSLSGRFSVQNLDRGGGQVTIWLPLLFSESTHESRSKALAHR